MTRSITKIADLGTRPSTPCREWRGSRRLDGYGRRQVKGRTVPVHRWVIEAAGEDQFGTPWNPDLIVMHLCDNPPCFRFDHLRLGSHVENARDRDIKGRQARPAGEQNPASKLSAEQVTAIRSESQRHPRPTHSELAVRYGVSRSMVTYILNGRSWRHLT